jgi:hypothetical protein
LSTPTEANSLLAEFSFLPGSLDLPGAVSLLRAGDLGFSPVEVSVKHPGPAPVTFPFDDTAWDRILQTSGATGFDLTMGGLTKPRLSCTADSVGTSLQLAGCALNATTWFDTLLATPGLILGSSGDGEDAHWQGEENPQHYRWWYSGEWEHLPRIVDKRGRELIDVSGNPGRLTHVAGIMLWAAQDLWFGPSSALVIAYDAIAQLPVGHLTDLGDGRWHVRLWEDDTPLEEIRKAQQTLRDHLGYDAAADRADEIRAALTARAV